MAEKLNDTSKHVDNPGDKQNFSPREVVLLSIQNAYGVDGVKAEKIYRDLYIFSRPVGKKKTLIS